MRKYGIVTAFFRVRWLIVLLIALYLLFYFVAPARSTPQLALYKLILGVAAAVIGHIVVKELYPYIDLARMVAEDKKDERSDATKFIGACILRGAVMAAVILGVLLGV